MKIVIDFIKRIKNRGDTDFWISFLISFILCCIFFLHPKTIEAFRELGKFIWIIIPVMIYCCTLFLSMTANFFILIFLYFYSEIKKAIIKKEYSGVVAIIFGSTIFVLMIFPILKMAFVVFVFCIFGIKLKIM